MKELKKCERVLIKAERKRIQEELEVAIKDGKLDISNGVLLWEIIQATPSYHRLILVQLHRLSKATNKDIKEQVAQVIQDYYGDEKEYPLAGQIIPLVRADMQRELENISRCPHNSFYGIKILKEEWAKFKEGE